jgi:hypothetical protein
MADLSAAQHRSIRDSVAKAAESDSPYPFDALAARADAIREAAAKYDVPVASVTAIVEGGEADDNAAADAERIALNERIADAQLAPWVITAPESESPTPPVPEPKAAPAKKTAKR